MEDFFRTLGLFIVGAPAVLGFLSRFKSYGSSFYWKTFQLTILMFLALGIGYSFFYYKNPPAVVSAFNGFLGVFVFLSWLVYKYYIDHQLDYEFKYFYILVGMAVVGIIVVGMMMNIGLNWLVDSLVICAFFVVAGAVFAGLGPIIAGFNISAALYALFYGEGLKDVFFWKDFFEMFEINSVALRFLLFFLSSASGLFQFSDYMRENFFDSDYSV